METVTVNARIKSTFLGPEDHGILTAVVHIDFGDSSQQGFGGYQFDHRAGDRWIANRGCGLFVRSVLSALEIPTWEELPGTLCRVRIEGGAIVAIGHWMRDQWFEPRVAMKTVRD